MRELSSEEIAMAELTYISMNFSGDVLSARASLLAISLQIGRLPVFIPEMYCWGAAPTLAPSVAWSNPTFSL